MSDGERFKAPLPAGMTDTPEVRAALQRYVEGRELPEGHVRVLRVVEYIGPRATVDDVIAGSITGYRLVPREGLVISGAVVEATAALDEALRAAKAACAAHEELCVAACASLDWPPPQTPTERNNGARAVFHALHRDEAPRWWLNDGVVGSAAMAERMRRAVRGVDIRVGASDWARFRDKVRELFPKNVTPSPEGVPSAQD